MNYVKCNPYILTLFLGPSLLRFDFQIFLPQYQHSEGEWNSVCGAQNTQKITFIKNLAALFHFGNCMGPDLIIDISDLSAAPSSHGSGNKFFFF